MSFRLSMCFLANWMPDLESKSLYDFIKIEAVRRLHEIKNVEDMQDMRRTISNFDQNLDALVKIAAIPEGFENMKCKSNLPSLLKNCKGWQDQPENMKKQLEDGVTGRWISLEDMPMMQYNASRLSVIGSCFPCAIYVQDATTVNEPKRLSLLADVSPVQCAGCDNCQ
jgi:hypothetical protein